MILSGPSKASHIKIFQRSLQRMIYTYIAEHDNLSYIHYLPFFVNSYNERVHTTTKYTPNEVVASQEIQRELEDKNIKNKILHRKNKRKPTLHIGDSVRISL